jgi:hypothetical protein
LLIAIDAGTRSTMIYHLQQVLSPEELRQVSDLADAGARRAMPATRAPRHALS